MGAIENLKRGQAGMSGTINTLQVGRAVAALMVVAHHAGQSVDAFVTPLPEWLHIALAKGFLGVDFFFVLSGFIIYYTAFGSSQRSFAFSDYASKRLIRVFVPYLPVAISLVAAYSFLPALSEGNRDWSLLATITLLPSLQPPALSVAWTLQHELIFYFLFALFVALGSLKVGMICWATAIVTTSYLGVEMNRAVGLFLSPINLEFLFGMIAAHAYLRKKTMPNWLYATGIVIPLLIFVASGLDRSLSFLFGLSLSFLVLSLANYERRKTIFFSKIFLLLGDASYSIYLIHNPLLSLTSRLFTKHVIMLYWPASLTSSLVVCVILGVAYHLYYENVALNVVRKIRKSLDSSSKTSKQVA